MDRVVIRSLLILSVMAAIVIARPAAAANATGNGAVVITEPAASIQVTQDLTFQNMVPTAPVAGLMVTGAANNTAAGVTSAASAASAATPASVSLKGSPGDTVSLSVPAALELSRA